MLRPLALAFAVLVSALAAGCGGGGATTEDFRQDLVSARNDADEGLEQIVYATSTEDLLARMRIGAVEVRGAATDVREADAPEEFEDEREQLADGLLALSDEIAATVDTLAAFPDQLQNTSALNFVQWDTVQESLRSLRKQGVQVPLLERHQPEAQPE